MKHSHICEYLGLPFFLLFIQEEWNKKKGEGFDKIWIVLFFWFTKVKKKTANENKGLKIKHKGQGTVYSWFRTSSTTNNTPIDSFLTFKSIIWLYTNLGNGFVYWLDWGDQIRHLPKTINRFKGSWSNHTSSIKQQIVILLNPFYKLLTAKMNCSEN